MGVLEVPESRPMIVGSSTQVDPAFWMKAANEAIRSECGWHVAPIITETLRLDGNGSRVLLLPSKRIRKLIRVTNDGDDVTDRVYASDRHGMLELDAGHWSRRFGGVTVELEHGFNVEEVADVAALIVTLTSRAAGSARNGNIVQQGIGGASIRVGTNREGGAHSVPLMDAERTILAPYKLSWGA